MGKKTRKYYVEVLEILKHIPIEEYNKIPKEKIEVFEKFKDENYVFEFDPTKNIEEQNISKNAYAVFIVIYMNYIATELEKKKIQEILELNAVKSEIEKKLEFGTNIFQNEQIPKKIEKEIEEENTNLIIAEETNIIARIIKKIKKFLNF